MGSINIDISLGQKSIFKDYLYMDVNMDINILNNNRDILTNYDFDAIQNSIRNIFGFRKGEKILNPDFGNNLYNHIYEGITNEESQLLGQDVLDLINKWEPRVKITKLNVYPRPDQNEYYVELYYIIPALDNNKVLNYNFNLSSQAGGNI